MKNLYTYKEIKDKIKSNDYNAEMLLQHLLLNFEEIERGRDKARELAVQLREYYEGDPEFSDDLFPWEKGIE